MQQANLFTIPPDVPFLKALARAILRGGFPLPGSPPPGPLDLPHWTIYLPTRRAARALAQAFLEEGGGTSRLLPSIRTLGDVDEEELAFAEPLPGAGLAELPPAISGFARRFLLSRLIADWASRNPQEALAASLADAPAMCLSMAKSLGLLLDSFESEEVGLARLRDLEGPEYPGHREALLGFLSILRDQYPHELERLGLLGAAARRAAAIRAEAEHLQQGPGKAPVIAAGSTGSMPAVAELLKVIARLPMGAVVLPGLDLDLDEAAWAGLADFEQQQHPQWGLHQLLRKMGCLRGDVRLLPEMHRSADGPERAFLLSELMRPSMSTDHWRGALAGKADRLTHAMGSIRQIVAPDSREEAAAIAYLMRATLETPGRTAALVSPDRNLARRVKAELARWNIEPNDTAGEPLARASAAVLLRLVLEAAQAPLDPQSVIALARHPLACFGFASRVREQAADVIDLSLRGLRPPASLAGLPEFLGRRAAAVKLDRRAHPALRRLADADWKAAQDFASRMAEAVGLLVKPATAGLKEWIDVHLRAAAHAAGDDRLWRDEAGEALSLLFQKLLEAADACPSLALSDYLALITDELLATPLRTRRVSHPRLAVYGLLESRLVSADVMILGGLVETVWPQEAETDPWLSRPMKKILGLMLPERRIGLTAHDFTQGFSGSEIWLTSARKRDGVPVVPSRWLLRLKALLKVAGAEHLDEPDVQTLSQALGLDMPGAPRPTWPAPRPAARPRDYSVTRVENLIRDPYGFYARTILELEPLAAAGAPGGHADRGSLIHDAMNLFTKRHPGPIGADGLDNLLACGREVFAASADEKEIHGFWWPQFVRMATWFIEQEVELRRGVSVQHTEIGGRATFDIDRENYSLSARADRMDLMEDGSLRILDYKTGTLPSLTEMRQGFSPQLPLEAWIAASGGFKALGPRAASLLTYIKLAGSSEPPGEIRYAKAENLGDESFIGLCRLLAAYANPEQPFLPLPDDKRLADFDHLARYAEWMSELAQEDLP